MLFLGLLLLATIYVYECYGVFDSASHCQVAWIDLVAHWKYHYRPVRKVCDGGVVRESFGYLQLIVGVHDCRAHYRHSGRLYTLYVTCHREIIILTSDTSHPPDVDNFGVYSPSIDRLFLEFLPQTVSAYRWLHSWIALWDGSLSHHKPHQTA